MGDHTNMALYILKQPSSWSTSRIRLSWPWSRGRLSFLLVLFPQVYSCLLWPTQYLAVCSKGSYFALNPFLAYWPPNTVQVNNTSALHHIHTDKHIYITSVLLFSLLHTSSTPSGRLAAPDPSRRAQLQLTHLSLNEQDTLWTVWGYCAISLLWHHVSLVQRTTCLLPVMRDPGSIPRGILMWNQDSLVSIVSLQYFLMIVGEVMNLQYVQNGAGERKNSHCFAYKNYNTRPKDIKIIEPGCKSVFTTSRNSVALPVFFHARESIYIYTENTHTPTHYPPTHPTHSPTPSRANPSHTYLGFPVQRTAKTRKSANSCLWARKREKNAGAYTSVRYLAWNSWKKFIGPSSFKLQKQIQQLNPKLVASAYQWGICCK